MKNIALLIDDDEIICELGTEMLEMLDVKAIAAFTKDEAIKSFQNNYQQIAFVLVDLNIGKESGLDVFHELKKIDENVVAITASGSLLDSDADKYIAMGFSGIVTKPYSIATLKKLIDKYVER
jgi:DNA-binding NtrC family response regulator